MIYKRGRIYWYKFTFRGRRYQQTTRLHNAEGARKMEAAHRTSLALGEVGLRDRAPVPTLSEFLTHRVLPWAEATFAENTPKSLKWFRNESRVLKSYKPLARLPLNEINGAVVAGFASWRIKQGKKVSTVNSSIRVLRRSLSLASEWEIIVSVPKLKVLSGAESRDHVITREEEDAYLTVATEPLKSVATILIDTGLRPEECFRLRWEFVRFSENGKGVLEILRGKSKKARRAIPMTNRVYNIFHARWQRAGKPNAGFVFPAPKAAMGHIVPNSIYQPHLKAIKESKVRPFVLYSLRHTFLTRLGESGCDAWTLARIAGHSSIAVSQHYVHASDRSVLDAIKRFDRGSYKNGYSRDGGRSVLETRSVVSSAS